MRVWFNSALGGLAFAALLASSADASMVYAGPDATDHFISLNFSSESAPSGVVIFDGYRTIDGKNFYADDFSPRLNNSAFNLAGDNDSRSSHANVFSHPFGTTLSNPATNRTGIGFGGSDGTFSFSSSGGKETFSVSGLPLKLGSNTLTLTDAILDTDHSGFHGLGLEGFGVEKAGVSATPLPPTWTMMLIGLAGFVAYRRKSRPAPMAACSARWN